MNFREIEKYLGKALPQEYKDEINSDIKYKIEYKEWPLFSESELMKEINLSGHRLPYYKILEGYFKIYDDVKFKNKVKLKKAVAISDENSDILFFDNHLAVYIFFHSSLEVIKVANSFKDLVKYKIIPASFVELEIPKIYGKWIAHSSPTLAKETLLDIFPMIFLNEDKSGLIEYRDIDSNELEEVVDFNWKTVMNSQGNQLLTYNDSEYFIDSVNEKFLEISNSDRSFIIKFIKDKA